jgi:hypothetical protein
VGSVGVSRAGLIVSASSISSRAERSHLAAIEVLVLLEKRRLKPSKTRLQSLKLMFVCLFRFGIPQRFDGCHLIRTETDPRLVLVEDRTRRNVRFSTRARLPIRPLWLSVGQRKAA